ncbi:UNVERIFIED_CONTAM: hypothetical protein GTU68_043920 [Idotea baltica]|nr:hypothetical protein [Idotea baltica]
MQLCTFMDGIFTSGKIVETEAYKAPEDKASHAYGNKRTNRTETIFSTGGVAYVYLCYGIHHLFNIVTGEKDQAHAILVRGLEPVEGIEHMLARRKMTKMHPRISNGPGILSKALGITTKMDGRALYTKDAVWIEKRRKSDREVDIISGPRVGVGYAQECAEWPWRFRIKGNPYCSPAK